MSVDIQAMVDGIGTAACVMSVEKLPDGGRGTIRIVTGNQAYIDSIERPMQGTELLVDKFVPNCEYTRYLTRDLNLEEYSFRAATKGECLRSYANPDRFDAWMNINFLPLDYQVGNLYHCLVVLEFSFEPDTSQLTSVRNASAARVLECAVKLRNMDNFNLAMGEVAGDVREMCRAQYCCVLLVDEEKRDCSVLAESIAEGSILKPMANYIDAEFYEIVESWEETISGSYCLIAKDKNDMNVVKERNPRWYESLTGAFVENIVLYPLKSHDELLGYIWVVNFDPDMSRDIMETLELMTYVLASEVDNYLLVHRLTVLSSQDMLTGVMNRNEMNRYVEALSNGEEGEGLPLGVIFADLNGLKAINDNQGHAAGDRLLKDAASVLDRLFDPQSVFRAGGDEFVVILPGASEVELMEKVDALKGESERTRGVSFAIGSCAIANCKNVRDALQHADARMYEDKETYYHHR